MLLLVLLIGEGLIVELLSTLGVECQMELVSPAEFKSRLTHRIVPQVGRRVSLRQVSSMGSELIGHDSLTDVIALGEAEVLLLRDVAEHGGTLMPDDRGTDSPRDVVVASTDIGDQRAEGVEGGFIAVEEFARHILGDEVHGDVTRSLDHHLHVVASSDAIEFAESLQLCHLCRIVGVMDTAWTQAIAEG